MNLRPSSSQGDIQESDDEDAQGRIYVGDELSSNLSHAFEHGIHGSDDIDEAQRPLEQDDAETKCFLDESVVSSPSSVNGQESSLLAFEGVANDRSDVSPGIHENEDPVELPKAGSKHQSPGDCLPWCKESGERVSANQDKKRVQGLFERWNSRERADEARRNEEPAREARTAANREHKARRKALRAARLLAEAAAAAAAAADDPDEAASDDADADAAAGVADN